MNPRPIVMMLRESLRTTARPNKSNNPAHINRIMSKGGARSLSPVNKANKVGIVAQLMTTMANHPKVSALTLGK
jgi:hypothetical protein